MRLRNLLLVLFLFASFWKPRAQVAPFQIQLEPLTVPNVGGLQSYAFAQHNGKWLIIGGRLDGLHRRQPWAAFDIAGHNNQLIVIDPVTQQSWQAPLSTLPAAMQEQLSSTNMQFYQEGDYLYFLGGYGYSATIGDHTTFANLTAIKVPEVIDAIVNGNGFSSHFRQVFDPKFQVTGGKLVKIYGVYYLVGGHKFLGRYNPMGPTHGPGFTQEYTNAIRKFSLTDNGTTISIGHLPELYDANTLHRRDFNVVPQILPNGNEGATAFSGVFQQTVDLPFLDCVNIDSASYSTQAGFQQFYNHYHCPVLPIYSAGTNEMHTVFFGGIAQYYDNGGVLVQDNNVPFTKTIARVTRDGTGLMSEHLLPVEMPALLGAGAEFIPHSGMPHYANEVIDFDAITADTVLVGHIYGGISSSAKNIFFVNTGAESNASSQIFRVYLIKNGTVGRDELNVQSISSLQLIIYPNPNEGDFQLKFHLSERVPVKISVFDAQGRKIEEKLVESPVVGENIYRKRIRRMRSGKIYFITVETPTEKATQKIIVE